jgi:hypothetical protein
MWFSCLVFDPDTLRYALESQNRSKSGSSNCHSRPAIPTPALSTGYQTLQASCAYGLHKRCTVPWRDTALPTVLYLGGTPPSPLLGIKRWRDQGLMGPPLDLGTLQVPIYPSIRALCRSKRRKEVRRNLAACGERQACMSICLRGCFDQLY